MTSNERTAAMDLDEIYAEDVDWKATAENLQREVNCLKRAAREPRVWFGDEDIPCGVHVLDADGEIHRIGDDDDPIGEPHRMIGFGALVEVRLPDHRAAVAAERARRDSA